MEYVTTCGTCGWAAAEVTTVHHITDGPGVLPGHGQERDQAEGSLVYVLDCLDCGGQEARSLCLSSV